MVLQLNENALRILRSRYLRKDHEGAAIESTEEMFHRVANHVASMEARFDPTVKADGMGPHLWIESALLVWVRLIVHRVRHTEKI
jgi:ribonucleotide reductase alpha subunit